MNKQFLLTALFFSFCCSAKAEEQFDLSKERADYLLNQALYLKLQSCQRQLEARSAEYEDAEDAKAEQELIEFGNQAHVAKKTDDLDSLAGKTSAVALLKQLKSQLTTQYKNITNPENYDWGKSNSLNSLEAKLNATARDMVLLQRIHGVDAKIASLSALQPKTKAAYALIANTVYALAVCATGALLYKLFTYAPEAPEDEN